MKRILYTLSFVIVFLSLATGQQITVQEAATGNPLPFCHLRVLSQPGLLFVADQQGVFSLPNDLASGELAISHVGFETLVVNYRKGEALKVSLKEKAYDLGAFEVTPTSEKEVFKNALEVFSELMDVPTITKAYYRTRGFRKDTNEKVYHGDYFGTYLYKELVDRSKKRFEWFENGLNGFVAMHSRKWYDESLEAASKFENFNQHTAIGRIIHIENYGYLNDLLFIVSDLKFKDLQYNEEKSEGPYELYTYQTDDVNLEIKIHFQEQRIAHIQASQLPRPRQPYMLWSMNKQMEVSFAWDEIDYLLFKVIWKDVLPDHEVKTELFLLEQNAAWSIGWNKEKTSSFFIATSGSYFSNYDKERWRQMGLTQYLVNYSNKNENVKTIQFKSSEPINDAVRASRDYWRQFMDYLYAIGIQWGF